MNKEYWDYMYVLWVKTGREEQALKQIHIVFGDTVTCIHLLVEKFFRKQGKVFKIIKPAFPGYIFVTTDIENNDFLIQAKKCTRNSMSILKPLCYNGTYQAAMREDERAAIDLIWQGKDCIETSTGFFVGDHVVIIEGPFKGRESVIVSISPRKREAIVEMEFLGTVRRVTIGLEIIEKMPFL